MPYQESDSRNEISVLVVQTVVALILLFFVWIIIVNLPMLEEIKLPLDFTLPDLLGAVLLTVIAVALYRFGSRIENAFYQAETNLPQIGTIIRNVCLLVSLLLIYFAYRPLVVPYMGELDWVYHILFLIAVLVALVVLVNFIYLNTEYFTDYLTLQSAKPKANRAMGTITCSSCDKKYLSEDGIVFCSQCGEKLPQPKKCTACGKMLKDSAKFCMACGEKVGVANKTLETIDESCSETSCLYCGDSIKANTKFCSSCGMAQNKQ
jgi:hypothetical protein